MSFLEDNKNIGLLVLIVGIMTIVAAIVLVAWISGHKVAGYTTAGTIVSLVGALISGIIFILAGLSVRDSKDDQLGLLQMFAGMIGLKIAYDIKIGIPALLVMVMGITSLINGVFAIIAGGVNGSVGAGISAGIIGIIIGIFFLIAAPIVAGNKKSSSGSIIWIILLILTVLGILGSFFALFVVFIIPIYGLFVLIVAICSLLLYIFLLLAFLSPEIKKTMGVD